MLISAALADSKEHTKKKHNQSLQPQVKLRSKSSKQEEPVHEEIEELPDLRDLEVQKATLAIQKAYIKKKGRASKPEMSIGLTKKSEPVRGERRRGGDAKH